MSVFSFLAYITAPIPRRRRQSSAHFCMGQGAIPGDHGGHSTMFFVVGGFSRVLARRVESHSPAALWNFAPKANPLPPTRTGDETDPAIGVRYLLCVRRRRLGMRPLLSRRSTEFQFQNQLQLASGDGEGNAAQWLRHGVEPEHGKCRWRAAGHAHDWPWALRSTTSVRGDVATWGGGQ